MGEIGAGREKRRAVEKYLCEKGTNWLRLTYICIRTSEDPQQYGGKRVAPLLPHCFDGVRKTWYLVELKKTKRQSLSTARKRVSPWIQ